MPKITDPEKLRQLRRRRRLIMPPDLELPELADLTPFLWGVDTFEEEKHVDVPAERVREVVLRIKERYPRAVLIFPLYAKRSAFLLYRHPDEVWFPRTLLVEPFNDRFWQRFVQQAWDEDIDDAAVINGRIAPYRRHYRPDDPERVEFERAVGKRAIVERVGGVVITHRFSADPDAVRKTVKQILDRER